MHLVHYATKSKWDYFQVLSEHDKRKHVVCIFCNTEYKNAIATGIAHFEKCRKCPSDVKYT